MTRGELRALIRAQLGEPTPGTWTDADLNSYIQTACDTHAREALSVEGVMVGSSLPGVTEYLMPQDYGELIAVRFQNPGDNRPKKLKRATRDNVLNWNAVRGAGRNRVRRYYLYKRSIGLYPTPNKKAVFSYDFSSEPTTYTDVVDPSNDRPYSITLQLSLDPRTVTDSLDPTRVYISHIGLYLKRDALQYPGNIFVRMTQTQGVDIYANTSYPILARSIAIRPQWYNFDFSHNPIELVDDAVNYTLSVHGDERYVEVPPSTRDGKGIRLAYNVVNGRDVAFFRLHRLKNDLEADYFRNSVRTIQDDRDEIEVPHTYYPHLENLILAKCYAKRGMNMKNSQYYGNMAKGQIAEARVHAKQMTRDPIPREEETGYEMDLEYATYNQETGLWHTRL